MANRSYLYSADAVPTTDAVPAPVRGISEHNWDIPLAHHLFVGRETTIVPSMIWSGPYAVAGDFAGGSELLTSLLRAVGEEEIPDRAEFDRTAKEIGKQLAEQSGRYFLMEIGELIPYGTGDPAAWVRDLVEKDIRRSVERATAAIAGGEREWLAAVRENWQDHFASFYSEVLYFSFPGE